MIFDTNILFWVQKGNKKAARVIDQNRERKISILIKGNIIHQVQCMLRIDVPLYNMIIPVNITEWFNKIKRQLLFPYCWYVKVLGF